MYSMTKPDKQKRKKQENRFSTAGETRQNKNRKGKDMIEIVDKATTAVEAVDLFQAAAWEMDHARPPMAGCWHAEVLPRRHEGAHWVWARVETRGTGNGGRWVATRPLTPQARAMRGALMGTLSRLLPGFNVAYLATKPLFWERPVLSWMDALSPEMAKMLGDQPGIKSRREAEILEWKGFPLPKTSVPRTSAAIAMAAAAAAGR